MTMRFRRVVAVSACLFAAETFAQERAQEPTGGSSRPTTRIQLLRDVNRGWSLPGESIQPNGDVPDAGLSPLEQKLDAILLPAISFNRAELAQVISALGAAAEEFDLASGPTKGVNLVLADPANRKPTVSITLRNVTLRRALDLVTQSVGYDYDAQPDAVIVRPGGDAGHLETRFYPVSRAAVARMIGVEDRGDGRASRGASAEKSGPMGESAAIRAFLQQAGVSFALEGTALAYDGSALIVTQTLKQLQRIRTIVARFHETRQVEIEAKFMEVQDGALEELGVLWNASRRGVPRVDPATGNPVLDQNGRQVFLPQEMYTTAGVNRTLAGAFPASANNPAITIDSPGAPPSVVDGTSVPGVAPDSRVIPVSPPALPGSVSLGAGAGALASVTGFVGEFDVSAVIRALAQKQGTDLLSSPRVTVLSGHTASITVAQEMRYPQSYGEMQSQVGSGSGTGTGISAAGVTITAGTPQDFATRNVGVELKVTPTVEEDGQSISLELNPKVTEFEGFVEYGGPSIAISSGVTVKVPPGFYQPIFSVRDIATRVTIWDGATLVMGGLTREEVKKVDDKVPILGSIPLLGRLFRSKGESAQKRNLLIFVTARLVTPGGGSARPAP